MPHLFCCGLGRVALALADRLIAEGWTVSGSCRSPDKAAALTARGIDAVVGSRAQPPEHDLAGVTHLLASIPPDETGDPALELWRDAILRQPGIGWIGYLSSTAVYGDRGGAWVDEATPVAPVGARGARRVAAERAWLALPGPVQIFRLAAIYGPGANALASLRAGTAQRIIKPGLVFSRIHVDDIVTVLAASIARPKDGAIYNLADDEPAPPDEVIAFAAELLGMAPPAPVTLEEAGLSPQGQAFFAESKRIANHRIKQELGVRLRYPSYREGLRALLRDET